MARGRTTSRKLPQLSQLSHLGTTDKLPLEAPNQVQQYSSTTTLLAPGSKLYIQTKYIHPLIPHLPRNPSFYLPIDTTPTENRAPSWRDQEEGLRRNHSEATDWKSCA